jgi:hypothetical protein
MPGRRRAVDQHGAGAANAVLAAEMRAGQAALFAQKVAEMRTRLDRRLNATPVDGESDRRHRATIR